MSLASGVVTSLQRSHALLGAVSAADPPPGPHALATLAWRPAVGTVLFGLQLHVESQQLRTRQGVSGDSEGQAP